LERRQAVQVQGQAKLEVGIAEIGAQLLGNVRQRLRVALGAR